MRNEIIAPYYTGVYDTQRNSKWEVCFSDLEPLIYSCQDNNLELKIINNTFKDSKIDNVEYISHPCVISPYFQRWIHFYQYLRAQKDIDFAFCVDSTDVEVINNPFENIKKGVLYCGDEEILIKDCKWLHEMHKSNILQDFFKEYGESQMLNCGIIGGDRETLKSLLHHIIWVYFNNKEAVIKNEDVTVGESDMGVFNYVMMKLYKGEIVHGRTVTNVFKSFEKNNKSFFKHK